VVAFRTGATQSQRPTEEVAIRTAALADEALLALWTFVDCVGRESLLAPQLLVRLIRLTGPYLSTPAAAPALPRLHGPASRIGD
jgi:hypothetical protein